MQTFAGLLATASVVAAHGYVNNATIGSSAYTFYQPYTDPYMNPTPERVSRPIQGNGPVTDLTYQDIQCGGDTVNGIKGSSPANLTASVAAGSTVDLYWTLWPTSHVGPSITYMAKCDNDDCTTFMPESDAVWFKIQEVGRTGTSDVWGTTPIMTAGGYISYTIPECIPAGAYLVRHEVIALHSAGEAGGAQFYPGCHQITVTGGGSTTPANLVSFPGAYASSDAGITYDVYTAQTYTIPGPALFSCSGDNTASTSTAASNSSSAAVTASVNVAAAATTTAAATTGDDSDDDSCVEETVTSTLPAATATATASASSSDDDGEDDGCDAEDAGSDSSSITTGAATVSSTTDDGSDGEDDSCDEDPAAATTTTATSTTAQATATAAAAAGGDSSSSDDDGEDDGCDADDAGSDSSSITTGAATTTTTTSDDDGSDDDACDEEATATATGSAAAATTATGDDEDCDAEEEQQYARRFTGRFARGM